MSLPAVPAPPVAPSRPRRRLLLVVTPLVVLLAALAVTAGVQLNRPAPAGVLRVSVPGSLSIPGQVTDVPWPARGQAHLGVDGLGTIGSAGDGASVPIGSVAKVMTAYVVLIDHPLDVGQDGPAMTVTAADVADYRARIPSGQSLVPVTAGERLTERQALQALMLPSANNVAQMLAKWDAGGADAFVAKMNTTAASLGMAGTHYTDPSGFAPTTVSTAADQTRLAEQALKLPAFAEIVAQPSATLPVAGTVRNYNSLLGVDGVFGIKTGSTDEAGGNLLFAAHLTVADKTLTVVGAVLGQPGRNTDEQLAAVNAIVRPLLTAARRLVRVYTVLPAGTVGEVRTAWGETVPVRTASDVQVIGWPGLTVTVTVRPERPGPRVTSGQQLGALTAHTIAGDVTTDLRADATVTGPSRWWRLTRTS
ncbi:D-alanyl-D-alanine carboxypeptidase family protein [Planosporangium sp. 12N6]|uniref:D-alanyl-D-alanine carboxypeptidase family protein n=1 Tax=Planosporangium spinosum TaxID=3402278 RepID=UPI003CE7B298